MVSVNMLPVTESPQMKKENVMHFLWFCKKDPVLLFYHHVFAYKRSFGKHAACD